jgi:hypothetical protein
LSHTASLKRCRAPSLEVKFPFTLSLQALLNAERFEDDLRRAHAQLAEVLDPNFITEVQSHKVHTDTARAASFITGLFLSPNL